MNTYIPMHQLKIGQSATVKELGHKGSMRRRLQDIGLVENGKIECIGRSPFGDPTAYLICGAVIAIRRRDASYIKVCVDKGE